MYLPDEAQRLQAVREYDLDSEVLLDELLPLNRLASALFDVPTSMVSVVDVDHTLFASRLGLEACAVERDISFCHYALDRDEPMVILDASLDPQFSANPLVQGDAHVRFYAGMPLRSPSGHVIGTFCILDARPRNAFNSTDVHNLKLLAGLALDRLEQRRLKLAQEASEQRFRLMSATSPAGIICADHDGLIRYWNSGAEAMFGFTAVEAEGQSIDLIVPDRMKGGHNNGLQRAATGGPTTLIGKSIELLAQRKDGVEFPIELALSMWRLGGRASFGAVIRDLSKRRATEERLHQLAHFDHLTGLPNRRVLRERLEELTSSEQTGALLVIDLDGFKQVNDVLGHSAGDMLLMEVAARLIDVVSPTDTVARIGGDEFAIILPAGGEFMQAGHVADRVIERLSEPFVIDGHPFNLSASVGVALHPLHAADAEELLSSADLALYEAKAEGRHCRRFFTSGLRQSALIKRDLDAELRLAAERGEFELFYQPQVNARTGGLCGAEALLRWKHPVRGLQSPAAFLPNLEHSVLASSVGRWILVEACRQAAVWRQSIPGLRMGVNLFGTQFLAGNLVRDVRGALEAAYLPAEALELEITENIILRHDEAMTRPLQQLREDGVQLAFDDYGTGYASLSLLKRYPITCLKIDQSFVRNLSQSREDRSIVRAIVHLGKGFGLRVIAEGVETDDQRERLTNKGCDELQGFLFGRPVAATDFAKLHLTGTGLVSKAA